MSKISSKETKPEILVRKYLFANGFRYRKNDKHYLGKSDIVIPKYKTVIFVHGCFWHGHSCKAGKLPKTRTQFWKDKIQSNINRDKKNISDIEKSGWNVIVIWQCEIKNKRNQKYRLNTVVKEIKA